MSGKRSNHGRIMGRKGVQLRKARLARNPLCSDCMAKGLVTAATVPDHIVPLARGGLDVDSNIRCLCAECHRVRTAEQFGHRMMQETSADGWPVGGG